MNADSIRLRQLNDKKENRTGKYVLYWMVSNRRAHYNFALEHAVEEAIRLDVPLLVFEPLRAHYPWSSRRMHQFVLEGMADNDKTFGRANIEYFPYVEPQHGAGKGLLQALAKESCLIVTDEYPTFFIPRMQRAFASRAQVQVVSIDSNGLMPLRYPQRPFSRAYDYRRYFQKELESFILEKPKKTAWSARLPRSPIDLSQIFKKWAKAEVRDKKSRDDVLSTIPYLCEVQPGAYRGGRQEALKHFRDFFPTHLDRYHEKRNDASRGGDQPFVALPSLRAHQRPRDFLGDHGTQRMESQPSFGTARRPTRRVLAP